MDFRDKNGQKTKGFSINVTESCDDKGLNLIGKVNVKKASTSDVDFFQEDIKSIQEVFLKEPENIHADGAYNSPDNQKFCEKSDMNLYLNAIQGAKSRYEFNQTPDGKVSVLDTKTLKFLETKKIINKENITKWRIKVDNTYKYFTQENLDTQAIRKKIKETPKKILQKRNNVEATIFQLAYHYSNSKSRYRGQIKHQMWANIRCLWVNFVRILNYIRGLHKNALSFFYFTKNIVIFECFFKFKSIFTRITITNIFYSKNIKFMQI